MIYGSGSAPENLVLTIQEDGSYHIEAGQAFGPTGGKGTIVISEGRLMFQGERGRGVRTVARSANGDRVMNVEVTLSNNSILTAKLSPSR